MDLSDFLLLLVDLLLDVVLLRLEGTRVLVLSILLLQLVQLSVQSVYLVLLLRDLNVSLLYIPFELLDLSFFLLELVDEIV